PNRSPIHLPTLSLHDALPISLAAAVSGATAWAQLPPDPAGTIEPLPPASPHWVWVNDVAFFAFPDGRAFLVDGDSGKMLGMLSTDRKSTRLNSSHRTISYAVF